MEVPVRVRKFGHSCLLVEEADAKILVDPGVFSPGWEELEGLDGVLVTHQHPDHLDLERLPAALLKANPDAALYLDAGSAPQVSGHGFNVVVVTDGDKFDINGLSVEVIGRNHAVIHPDIAQVPNVGYLIGERLFHPGDALTVPDREIEVLACPCTAPWGKIADFVDYLRKVAPRVAIPIHEAVYARPQMAYQMLEKLKPETTTLKIIDDGTPYQF
ncbi:MBL fold metallo-hydrolase [Fodinicola feengrottensis]|uniref:MBL fold metallo-hydrolase n=1 Tax=Fodinicola feengrottensis TaxID=435914 RepID=UPI0024426038|nr:MBL fold metallo-hydrolase [Fodinicola feengrottensis]